MRTAHYKCVHANKSVANVRQNSFNGNFPLFAIETILLSKRLDQCIKTASVF